MDIFKAAALGDVESLKNTINESNLEARDREGKTPLMVAVESSRAPIEAVEYLLQRGADPNAKTIPPERPDTLEMMKAEGFELPDMSSMKLPSASVLSIAAQNSSLEKIVALMDAGANPKFVDDSGYGVLLLSCYGAYNRNASENEAVYRLLHRLGAPYTAETKYGESVASVLSNQGHFKLLKVALELGADSEPLDWTPLFYAIAFNDMEQFHTEAVLDQAIEDRDCWDRTPFLLAVVASNLEAAMYLVDRGGDIHAVGRCGRTALMYAAENDDRDMCRWLIDIGCDVCASDEFDGRALKVAVERDSLDCASILIESGADVFRVDKHGFGLMYEVETPRMANLLLKAGLDASEIGSDVRKKLTDCEDCWELEVSENDYLKHRDRRFGNANPEKMNNAFWESMVRTRNSAYAANSTFEKSSFDFESPTWCFDRFGHSLTPLPDGRYVEIGGEHEDGYDPDFCIYNDVVVHDGKGTFEIYGYPESVFPPTDFHSATYVNGKIFVIGRLGYPDGRKYGQTPVFVLDCQNWSIKKIEVAGDCPGWIFEHNAKLVDDRFIEVSSGKIGTAEDVCDHSQQWVLDTEEMRWTKDICR